MLIGNDVCFLGATFYQYLGAISSTQQEAPIIFFKQSQFIYQHLGAISSTQQEAPRKHTSFSSKLTSPKIDTILPTFLGSTQEAAETHQPPRNTNLPHPLNSRFLTPTSFPEPLTPTSLPHPVASPKKDSLPKNFKKNSQKIFRKIFPTIFQLNFSLRWILFVPSHGGNQKITKFMYVLHGSF